MEYWGNYEQANASQSYWQGNPNSNFYNENPRNEPDFSWTSNAVPNPPYHSTYQHPYHPPYQPTCQHPYQPTYHDSYHPPSQPTYHDPYQQPYQPPNFQIPNFHQQPPPYNLPQPNDDLSELKVLMQQILATQIAFQEDMNAPPIQPAVPENREEYSYTRPSITSIDRVNRPALENITSLDRVRSHPVEFSSSRLETIPLDRVTCRTSHTQSSNETTDRVKAPESPSSENSNVKAITSKPEAKIVIRLPFPNRLRQAKVEHQLDSRVDEVDEHDATVDVLEADSYRGELTSGQGEAVSEPVHLSETSEVRTSELRPEAIEVINLEIKFPSSDLNNYVPNDFEDCFIVQNITLSKLNPPSLIVSNVYIHETPLEKGRYFCIQGNEKLNSPMREVAEEEVRPEKKGAKRGTKRCWDPGGSFDEIRLVPWAWRRDSGNRFGGANGRGKQDDYDNPGGEQALTHSVH